MSELRSTVRLLLAVCYLLLGCLSTAVASGHPARHRRSHPASEEEAPPPGPAVTGREEQALASRARTPHILHQIFTAGEVEFIKRAIDGRHIGQHRKSCLDAHHTWEHRLWDRADAQLPCRAPLPVVLGYLQGFHAGKLLMRQLGTVCQLQPDRAARWQLAWLQDHPWVQELMCRTTTQMLGAGAAQQCAAIHTVARVWGLVLGSGCGVLLDGGHEPWTRQHHRATRGWA